MGRLLSRIAAPEPHPEYGRTDRMDGHGGHEDGAWRCKYGTWHGLYEECHCAPTDPVALPDPDRPGTTVRYAIDEHLVPDLRAVLTHPAVTVVRRPHYAKGLAS